MNSRNMKAGGEPSPYTYIRPTHGLGMRSRGNGLGTNLENIGGRILIMKEVHTHKSRMRHIRPTIANKPPWGHESSAPAPGRIRKRPGTAGRASSTTAGHVGVPSLETGTRSPLSRPSPGRNGPPSSAQGNHPIGGAQTVDFDVMQLPTEHQRVYLDLVAMLCAMTTEESRAVLEASYKEAEERKLLSSYTGIFPTLTEEDAPAM